MTYIELINRFWEKNRLEAFESVDVQLYMYLLYFCNRQFWSNPFQLPQRTVELELGLSRRQIDKAKSRLADRGLIRCKKGKGSASPWVEIDGLKIKSDRFTSGFVYPTDTQSDTQNEEKKGFVYPTDTQSDTQSDTQTQNTHSIYKDIKTIRHIDATHHTREQCKQPSLFKEEKKQKKNKKSRAEIQQPQPPGFEDVRQQFLLSGADRRLRDWELEARSFFDWFEFRDWKDKNGKSILRKWRSRANVWINDKETKQKEVKPTNIPTNGNHRQSDTESAKQHRDESYARVMQDLIATNPRGA